VYFAKVDMSTLSIRTEACDLRRSSATVFTQNRKESNEMAMDSSLSSAERLHLTDFE